jgi:hypothetical protein
MREEFNIATEADTRLWNKYTSNTYEQLAWEGGVQFFYKILQSIV